jgi:hypothetical protein
MTNRIIRSLALGALATLVSTAAVAAAHTTCSGTLRRPATRIAKEQGSQLRKGAFSEIASAKQRRQRGPRTSWQAVA